MVILQSHNELHLLFLFLSPPAGLLRFIPKQAADRGRRERERHTDCTHYSQICGPLFSYLSSSFTFFAVFLAPVSLSLSVTVDDALAHCEKKLCDPQARNDCITLTLTATHTRKGQKKRKKKEKVTHFTCCSFSRSTGRMFILSSPFSLRH